MTKDEVLMKTHISRLQNLAFQSKKSRNPMIMIEYEYEGGKIFHFYDIKEVKAEISRREKD